MIRKKYSKNGKKCRVRFKLKEKEAAGACSVHVLGDFNGWDPEATPLERSGKGGFSGEVKLKSGCDYRFRYLLDGRRWISDQDADGLVPNGMGDLDSVLAIGRRK